MVHERWRLLAFLNLLFFGCVFLAMLVVQFLFPPPLYLGWTTRLWWSLPSDWVLAFLIIFLFNLAVASFVVVSLQGFAFFPLSCGFLAYRGVLWGLLFYSLPTRVFLAALPIVVLEGEAYVFAATAGAVAGVSWLKPAWLGYEKALPMGDAFKRGFRECVRLYVFVAVLLVFAAIIETETIALGL